MKRTTYRITILTLALVMFLSLAALLGVNKISASAEGNVTVSGTNVFTATGGAEVIVDRQSGSGDDDYTMFKLNENEATVSYRRNLAYSWFEQATEGEGDNEVKTHKQGYFNMEIGFKNLDFTKYVITFESQQYNKTKDSKSVNYVMFFPEGSGVKVLVTDNKDDGKEEAEGSKVLAADHIVISFGDRSGEDYPVNIANSNDTENPVSGLLKNVGGNYAKYSTSSSSPLYPLIFNAEFPEGAAETTASMVLYSLNGQQFKVKNANHNDDGDYYYGGTVTDNQPPVLCLGEEITHFTVGEKIDFEYQVIDVLRSSPSNTMYYYLLTWDDYSSETAKDFKDSELYEEVKNDARLETDIDKYLPQDETAGSLTFDDNLKVDMAVKIYLKLTDTSGSNGESTEVFLDWYVGDAFCLHIKDEHFLAVAEDKQGVTYNYDGEDGRSFKDGEDGIVAHYQKLVDENAKNLSAGSSSYFYLPSPQMLFGDNATAYTDLRFNIYYYHNSQQSNTGLSYNNLSININQRGAYTFTVYATDAAGNNMYYIGEDGKPVEFESGDIWTMFGDKDADGDYNRLPWFTFNVGYTGAEFEEVPGKQSTAYVGTSYSAASFKVNGISGSYDTAYRLFLFNRADYYRETGKTLTYDAFISQMDGLFEGADTRKYFKEIPVVTESDADYKEYKDYGWDGTSTTFTPQDENAFYMIRAEVTDKQYNTEPVTCSLAVVASVNAKKLKGENDWLKNNIASVVLLVIAGVALIGIILLLVIKPKDKEDIDVQFENAKTKNKKKNK